MIIKRRRKPLTKRNILKGISLFELDEYMELLFQFGQRAETEMVGIEDIPIFSEFASTAWEEISNE